MTPTKTLLTALALTLFAALTSVSNAVAQTPDQRLASNCDARNTQGRQLVICQLRPLGDSKIGDVVVTSSDPQNQNPASAYQPYAPNLARTSILFAIDISNPRRARTVNQIKKDIEKIFKARKNHQQFGLATFSDKLNVVAPIGSDTKTLLAELAKVRAAGLSTGLFLSARDGVRLLNNHTTDRRALVIFSDGDAEDTQFGPDDVMKTAAANNVAVIGIGVPESRQKLAKLQSLQRMAEETNGIFIEADFNTKRIADAAFDRITTLLEKGGVVTIDVTPDADSPPRVADLTMAVTLENGNAQQVPASVRLPAFSQEQARAQLQAQLNQQNNQNNNQNNNNQANNQNQPADNNNQADNQNQPADNNNQADNQNQPADNNNQADNQNQPADNNNQADNQNQPADNNNQADNQNQPADNNNQPDNQNQPADNNNQANNQNQPADNNNQANNQNQPADNNNQANNQNQPADNNNQANNQNQPADNNNQANNNEPQITVPTPNPPANTAPVNTDDFSQVPALVWGNIQNMFSNWYDQLWEGNPVIIAAVVAILLGLIALLALLFTRKGGPAEPTWQPATATPTPAPNIAPNFQTPPAPTPVTPPTPPSVPTPPTALVGDTASQADVTELHGAGDNEPHRAFATLNFLDMDDAPITIMETSARIGRHSDNDVRLLNSSVHRHHAILSRKPDSDTFVIQDLSATLSEAESNGVFVNGTRVETAELDNGDIIELGEVRFRFDYI